MKLSVHSETGRLQSVIVHTPGIEVSLVNPELKDELLFDDIIFEEDARQEHLDMLKIFEAAMPEEGEIHQVTQLILECFEKEEARLEFIEHLIKRLPELNLHTIESKLKKLSAGQLMKFVIEGATPAIESFTLLPIPNLLFTRDLAAVVGTGILLSRTAKKARIRESLLMETLVMHHPLFSELRKNAILISEQETVEGGDVIVASDELVLIGMSERTSFSGLMTASEGLLKQGVKHVLAVDIPKQRSSMHLDTIFTFASEDECIVFPPAITERRNNVVELTSKNGTIQTRTIPTLKEGLEELLGREMTFINCGGNNRTNQFREQWTDGANVFALSPGVIVGYERNTYTFEALKEHDYQVMSQYEFVETFAGSEFEPGGQKIAVSFMGHELCRGRGGARCMTLPIARTK